MQPIQVTTMCLEPAFEIIAVPDTSLLPRY